MGTTARRGYPFPEATDLVIQGDDAIEALAAAVDVDVDWTQTVAHIGSAESTGLADGSVIAFDGGQSLMTGFTYGAGLLTYTGPAVRMFLACLSVEVATSGSNQASMSSNVALRVNGTEIEGSYDMVASTSGGGTLQQRAVVHKITTFLLLNPGDVVTAVAGSTPANGPLGRVSIKLHPIGGFQ